MPLSHGGRVRRGLPRDWGLVDLRTDEQLAAFFVGVLADDTPSVWRRRDGTLVSFASGAWPCSTLISSCPSVRSYASILSRTVAFLVDRYERFPAARASGPPGACPAPDGGLAFPALLHACPRTLLRSLPRIALLRCSHALTMHSSCCTSCGPKRRVYCSHARPLGLAARPAPAAGDAFGGCLVGLTWSGLCTDTLRVAERLNDCAPAGCDLAWGSVPTVLLA